MPLRHDQPTGCGAIRLLPRIHEWGCRSGARSSKLSPNCEPETIQFGLSLSFGDFSVGGGWQETDASDTTKRSVMDLGVGWSSGPLSLAAMYGQSNADGRRRRC